MAVRRPLGVPRLSPAVKHVVLLGDRNPSYLTHRELDAALRLLPAEVRAHWVDTDSPAAGRVSGADGLWVVPGSPYRDDDAVYAAITGARMSGQPFMGTCAGFQYTAVEFARLLGDTQDVGGQRKKVLTKAISEDLLFAPGADASYSNTGYILAGAVIDRVGGKSYETLLAERVLSPLGITEFGFGQPAAGSGSQRIEQPWGHRSSFFRRVPVAADDRAYINPPVFNSAGNLHISLAHWAKFVRDQLKGQKGQGALLGQALYERLQMPASGETGYANGWGVLVEKGVPVMLTHNGSDGNWYADVRAYPPTDMMLLVVTNDGREDDEAKAAAADIRRHFNRRYSPSP